MGIKDANNMGAAMAPAALDTLICHFNDTGRSPNYYDAIITGDLGHVGKEVEVLFEDQAVEEDKKYFKGHTQNYIFVKYETDENLENTLKST